MTDNKHTKNSYTDAGVSIDRGNTLVERIKVHVKHTDRPGVMGGIGGFGALFDLSTLGYQQPVLVSGTDGVGTKIKLAIESNRHDTIGIDLVAMCVNDLLVQGAEPLYFLDYYACSRLDVDVAEQVIKGIAEGCSQAGCALIGGETAEMPGMYQQGEYDLAGFCVGAVEKGQIIDGSKVIAGDIIIGISSSGPHSNGYSLIRKLLADSNTSLTEELAGRTLADILLCPTRIYVQPILKLVKEIPVNAIAHITGGGLTENLPRVLPDNVQADINCSSWEMPDIFMWLRKSGEIDIQEMFRTFNCGIGMAVIVDASLADKAIDILEQQGESAWQLGNVTKRHTQSGQVNYIRNLSQN